ncbi:MAG: tRNA (adenosine(37)-N6)-threonylcarbamoyltransferase complex ATPase subunit type 1 TsaE [FCB group bacterium]|jgi:tRNA threonylcarbamoyladenosine biosynthesis protein TsaE
MENSLIITNSSEETKELGFDFAQQLKPGDIVAFYGELGAGKTEFIKGICNFFGVSEIVNSPTFTLINQYSGTFHNEEIIIYHIDLYRIKSTKELEDIGLSEYIYSSDNIMLVEWAEKADVLLPAQKYSIQIKLNDKIENERTFVISQNL